MPYDPADPLKDRITDIGPRYFKDFLPPVIENNFGKWLYHEILEPGVLVHVAESGDEVYTVRVGACPAHERRASSAKSAKSQTSTATAI